jgi:hypothetical protein
LHFAILALKKRRDGKIGVRMLRGFVENLE